MDDLRTYLVILRRWWWLAAIPVVIVGILTAIPMLQPADAPTINVTYTATANYLVGLPPGADPDDLKDLNIDPVHARWITSEYMVAGLYDWVRSRGFAEEIQKELAKDDIEFTVKDLEEAIEAGFARSRFDFIVEMDDDTYMEDIIDAGTEILQNRNYEMFPQNDGENMIVVPLGEPLITETSNVIGIGGGNSLFDAVIRIALAGVFGLLLAFLAHYFDPRVRSKAELEALELPILGEIPRR